MERNLLLGEWLALHELGDLIVDIVRGFGEHGIGAHRGGGEEERRISGAVAVSEKRRSKWREREGAWDNKQLNAWFARCPTILFSFFFFFFFFRFFSFSIYLWREGLHTHHKKLKNVYIFRLKWLYSIVL